MKKSQDPVFKAIIIDHYKQPRCFGKPLQIRFQAEENNRTCGDHVELFLTEGSQEGLQSFRFTGAGCSLCIASASLMSSMLQDVSLNQASQYLQQFQKISEDAEPNGEQEVWQIFVGLRDYPVRSRCVRLPWQALEKILRQWSESSAEKDRPL